MTRAITLDGFDAMFAGNADPWSTFAARDEAHKRGAILHALGPGPFGRMLELAAGNGSNSVELAKRALRLDATEGTEAGTALVRKAVGESCRVQVERVVLPGHFPRATYDAVVVAEILYYLSPWAMAQVARDAARALRPGGMLVLAHHRIDFHDFAQHAGAIHARFLRDTGVTWRAGQGMRTGRWKVKGYRRG